MKSSRQDFSYLENPLLEDNEEHKEDHHESALELAVAIDNGGFEREAVIVDMPSFESDFQKSIRLLARLATPACITNTDYNAVVGADRNEVEKSDYKKYVKHLQKMEAAVLEAHKIAVAENKTLTLDYLNKFNDELAFVLPILNNPEIHLNSKVAAIKRLITMARPSKELMEHVGTVVSPIFGLLGGMLGLALGIPIGGAISVVAGLVAALTAMAKAGIFFLPTAEEMKILLVVSAGFGACAGAFYGATEGAAALWSLSHNTFFKPKEIQICTNDVFNSVSLKRALGQQAIAAEIGNSDAACIIPDIRELITFYATVDEKASAYAARKNGL